MSKELQTLNERIAERIGKDLVDLIPDDQWQQMVNREIVLFKNQKAPAIIQKVLSDAYMDVAKREVNKLIVTEEWDADTEQYVHAEITKFIAKSSGVIVAGMLSPSMSVILQDLKNRLY